MQSNVQLQIDEQILIRQWTQATIEATKITRKTTRPIRINAQAIPALKIVSIAPQPLNTTTAKSNAKNTDEVLIY